MNNTTKSSRVFVFDLLKVCLVVLVINVHARILGGYFISIFTPIEYFAVPVFLVISFFLTAKYFTNTPMPVEKLGNRLKRLSIPLLFWSAVGFLMHLNLFTFRFIFWQIITGEVVNVPLYFLNLLIVFTVIFWLISFLPFRMRLYLYGILIAISFYCQYSLLNVHFFAPFAEAWKNSYGRFVELLPYAVTGIYFSLIYTKLKRSSVILFILYMVAMLGYEFLFPKDFIPGFHYGGMSLYVGTLALFSLVLLISPLRIPSRIHKITETLGKYSFGVYLFHFPLLELIVKTHPEIKPFIAHNSILFVLSFTTLCFLICFLLMKLSRGKMSVLLQ